MFNLFFRREKVNTVVKDVELNKVYEALKKAYPFEHISEF